MCWVMHSFKPSPSNFFTLKTGIANGLGYLNPFNSFAPTSMASVYDKPWGADHIGL